MLDPNHGDMMHLIQDDWIADRDNRRDGLNDLRFVAGDQWDQAERNQRQMEGRPVLTINHLPKFVNQVAGQIREADFGVNVMPVSGKQHADLAKIYQGIIRGIEHRSRANIAYAQGATGCVQCGIGHWRISTNEPEDAPFEQEICIDRVVDPLSIVWDAQAVKIDKRDATRCWVTEWLHETAWKRRFPQIGDRALSDVPVDGVDGGGLSGLYWKRDKFVRIAELWWAEEVPKQIVMLDTGQIFDITDWPKDEVGMLEASGRIARRREVKGSKVWRRCMDGVDWLSDKEEWAGRHIPIVPVLGNEIAFDGKLVRKGLIRDAKDGQKLLNYWRSASAEVVGKAPKQPWLVTKAMVEGWEGYWTNANRTNAPFLMYNIDPRSPAQIPRRQDPPTAPLAILQEANLAVDDMKDTTGLFDPSIGAEANETSGRAILARQRQGNVGTFIYTDNFMAALQRTGEILVDLIPRIYDTERQVLVVAPDDAEEFVPINTELMDVDGERILVNDLSQGRFGVRVKSGPNFATARMEAQEHLLEAMRNNPNLWAVVGDLVFRNMDFPGSEEIADRLKRTIDPNVLGEDAEEDGAAPPQDPMLEIVQRLQLAQEEANVEKTEAEAADKRASAAKKVAEIEQIEFETGMELAGEAAEGQAPLPDEFTGMADFQGGAPAEVVVTEGEETEGAEGPPLQGDIIPPGNVSRETPEDPFLNELSGQ